MVAARSAGARRKKNTKASSYKDTLGGFTIIEVVLVLAIAGLIFLMVFIALPQLQRAQRDTQRAQDVSRVSSAVITYKSNHNGRLPDSGKCKSSEAAATGTPSGGDGEATGMLPYNSLFSSNVYAAEDTSEDTTNKSVCKFIKDYLIGTLVDDDQAFTDPYTGDYELTIANGTAGDFPTMEIGQMQILKGVRCDDDGEAIESSTTRDYTVLYYRESGGTVCQNSNQ